MARAPVGRQQLIDAARAELVDGNGAFELSGLTRRTGLSTGALYHHFGSKSGLLTAIYDGFYDGLRHAIGDGHLPTATGPRANTTGPAASSPITSPIRWRRSCSTAPPATRS